MWGFGKGIRERIEDGLLGYSGGYIFFFFKLAEIWWGSTERLTRSSLLYRS